MDYKLKLGVGGVVLGGRLSRKKSITLKHDFLENLAATLDLSLVLRFSITSVAVIHIQEHVSHVDLLDFVTLHIVLIHGKLNLNRLSQAIVLIPCLLDIILKLGDLLCSDRDHMLSWLDCGSWGRSSTSRLQHLTIEHN